MFEERGATLSDPEAMEWVDKNLQRGVSDGIRTIFLMLL
jgi:hypothetical protein